MAVCRQINRADHRDEDEWLASILSDVRRNGTRRITDQAGNVFELRQVSPDVPPLSDSPRPGEKISEWVARTLPPGEPIETLGLRNPERSGLYPAWMWQMWQDAEEEDDQSDDSNLGSEQHD